MSFLWKECKKSFGHDEKMEECDWRLWAGFQWSHQQKWCADSASWKGSNKSTDLPHHCLLWGFKLKNTASNFMSGFSLDSSQSDIYMHFNAVSFHPALCNSLSMTEASRNKQGQMKIWNQPLNCFFSPSLTGLLQLTQRGLFRLISVPSHY